MMDDSNTIKKQFFSAIFIPAILCLFMVLSFVMERGMDWDFHKAGIEPRQASSLISIFSVVFVHADWEHLLNNILAFFLLATALFFFYRELSIRVLFFSWILSGALLWLIGRESWHIGASGLIYAIAFFLFFSGIFRRYAPLTALSMVVVFVYGSMVWHLFPWQVHDPVSWEGHLSGGIAGTVLAVWYRNQSPQAPDAGLSDDESNDDMDDVEGIDELELVDEDK